MANMLDYLAWRGDILFSQLGLNDVDALIFSELSYLRCDGILSDSRKVSAPLGTVARTVLSMPEPLLLCRTEKDLALLQAVADSPRFSRVGVTCYENVFIPQEETQFAAMTFLLEDGSAFLAFRGTDSSLVGWKEDFNMSFRQSIPAQELAKDYVERFSEDRMPLRLGGHSKGGNLAVYAGAKCSMAAQDRILQVYNHDGPGFRGEMMADPGYLRLVPRIRSLVPQGSVFGMMLECLESRNVIHSDGKGILQHDPFTWQVEGKNFVSDTLTDSARFWDRTLTSWLAGLNNEERSAFFDGVFELLMQGDAVEVKDVLRPQNLLAAVRSITAEEEKRRLLGSAFQELVESAKTAHNTPQT